MLSMANTRTADYLKIVGPLLTTAKELARR